MPRRTAAFLLLLLAALAASGCAGGALTLYEENDLFSLRGSRDRYYTQGLRMSRVFPASETPELAARIASEFPLYDEEATTAIGVVVGQNIYTPANIHLRRDQPDDRPYAGWLYTGVVVSNQRRNGPSREGDTQETLETDVGVVGDPSLARQAQTRWHEIIGVARPRGWDHQVPFEPGVVVTYEHRRRWLFFDDAPLDTEADVIPGYLASVGNVDTHVAGEATARWGFNLPRDFGVNTISTTAMETTPRGVDTSPSAYLFGAGEARGVARNIFLDGNTFRDGPSVDKIPGVLEFRAGVAVQWKALRLTYAWITRSPEFHGQNGWSRYGSLSLGLFFDF